MLSERKIYIKEKNPDGTVIEMVVWVIPPDKFRPHGFKYRLHFGTNDGKCIVRYDNEKHKGDHKHLGNIEKPYHFVNLKTLLADFQKDVQKFRGKNEK